MEENFWEMIERLAAVVTIWQAMPRILNATEKLISKLKKRFKKFKRKLK